MDIKLFKRFIKQNYQEAQKKHFRVSERYVRSMMDDWVKELKLSMTPDELIDDASRYGLVKRAATTKEFLFPLALIINRMTPDQRKLSEDVLNEIADDEKWKGNQRVLCDRTLKSGFSIHRDRTIDMVKSREGLLTGELQTLQEIGDRYDITRERVRQIEEKFWDEVYLRSSQSFRFFLQTFWIEMIHNGGRLIIPSKASDYHILRFLCKTVNLPFLEFEHFKFAVMILDVYELDALIEDRLTIAQIYVDQLSRELDFMDRLPLGAEDIDYIAKTMVAYNRRHMIRAERIYLAFQKIGGPAHFTLIVDTHNLLFPEKPCTERSIRSAMNAPRYVNKFGFVWIGTHGTYALKEWGFEKPKEQLTKTVARIVEGYYNKTKKPAPLQYIQEEMKNYRKIFKPASVVLAATYNPELTRLPNQSFIPKKFAK